MAQYTKSRCQDSLRWEREHEAKQSSLQQYNNTKVISNTYHITFGTLDHHRRKRIYFKPSSFHRIFSQWYHHRLSSCDDCAALRTSNNQKVQHCLTCRHNSSSAFFKHGKICPALETEGNGFCGQLYLTLKTATQCKN